MEYLQYVSFTTYANALFINFALFYIRKFFLVGDFCVYIFVCIFQEDDDKDSQAYYNTVTSLKRINAFNM